MNRGLLGFPGAPVDPVPYEPKFSPTPTWRAPMGQDNSNAGSFSSGHAFACMFKVFRPITYDGICSRIPTTPSASLDIHMAVYDDDPTRWPGWSPGNIIDQPYVATGVTTSGFKSVLLGNSVLLQPGIYWFAVMHVHSTSGTQIFETRRLGTSGLQTQWWATMPHGTATTPNNNAGNDGSSWTRTGLTSMPARFGGSPKTDSNISGTAWFAMRVAAA